MENYVSICAIFKNEAAYLEEWIAFNLSQGVSHFYMYNNHSSDGYRDILDPYIARNIVTLIDWPLDYERFAQPLAYEHCIKTFGANNRWIAFVDIDEYLFGLKAPLTEVLKGYEAYPGLVVHWQCYGSADPATASSPLVTQAFLNRAPEKWVRNRKVKSIVDPSRTVGADGPHFFKYKDDECAVNEKFQRVVPKPKSEQRRRIYKFITKRFPWAPLDPYSYRGHDLPVSVDVLRINHYTVKSSRQFAEKQVRMKLTLYDNSFFRYHNRTEVFDPIVNHLYEK